MMERAEAIDGMEYAIWEVDQELISLIPDLRRRACTARVMKEADALIDTRNFLFSIASEILIEQVEV